jgi:hypothetical protein
LLRLADLKSAKVRLHAKLRGSAAAVDPREGKQMGETKENAVSITTLLTAVPIVGVILAIMYDLGYFGFVDASLFTLFSWSDHIVFALQAVLVAVVIAAILGWSLSAFTFDTPLNEQPKRRLWFLVVLFSAFAVLSALNTAFDMGLLWFMMAVIAVCAIYLKVRLAGVLISYSVMLLALAYGNGYYDAKAALRSPAGQTLFTTDGQITGNVFRSGERGMLFFDTATRKVNFLRWDEVKRLEAGIRNAL